MILLWGWISQNGLKIHSVFLDHSEKSNLRRNIRRGILLHGIKERQL